MLDFLQIVILVTKTNDFIFVIGRTWFFSFDMKKYTIFDYLLGHVSCLSADVNWIRLLSQEEQDGRRGESRIKKKIIVLSNILQNLFSFKSCKMKTHAEEK